MKQIGVLSDTHGHIDEKVLAFFANVDEIWHAGDIGSLAVIEKLKAFKPLKAVYGNIDGHDIRIEFPEILRFKCEDIEVVMTHIGGYPDKYAPGIKKILQANPPGLFVCGHSHILRVMFDKKLNCMHINPGAAGISGFHNVRTAVRFAVEGKELKEMEVWEMAT